MVDPLPITVVVERNYRNPHLYRKDSTMKAKETLSFISSVCWYLRLSQAKTLSQLAIAAMQLTRASLAQLGRNLSQQTGIATKHCIKRVDRFIGNHRVEPIEAMRGLVEWLARECQKLQFGYVIRIEPKVYIKGHGFAGRLTDFAIRPGHSCILHNVLYRKCKPIRQRSQEQA